MANIYINNKLRLGAKGLQIKDAEGSWVKLHHRQGDLDGACGVYSTIMGLLTIGYLSYQDISIYNSPDKRGSKGKMLSHFLEKQGMIRDGYFTRTLAKDIRDYCDDLNVQVHYKGEKIIDYVHDAIIENNPVIVTMEAKNFCHYVLAIGFEYVKQDDDTDKITKILCLDPDDDLDASNYWNCSIDVSKELSDDFTCQYMTRMISCKVRINNIMIISKCITTP